MLNKTLLTLKGAYGWLGSLEVRMLRGYLVQLNILNVDRHETLNVCEQDWFQSIIVGVKGRANLVFLISFSSPFSESSRK